MSGAGRVSAVGGVAALLGVLPLFALTDGRAWVLEAALAIAVIVAIGYGLRRVHAPAVLIPLAQLAGLALWCGVLVAADVAWLGFVPNGDWVQRMGETFRGGVDTIVQYAVPVPMTNGMTLLLVSGVGVVALLVDILAVGLRRPVLTGIPLAACYAIAAAIVGGGLDWWWFVPPAVGYLALLVSDGRTRVSAWGRSASPSAHHSGVPETDSLVRNGRRVGAVALAAAVAIPALVPVLTQGFLGSGGNGSGGQTIRTDNPIVDLQDNLNRPENVELLTYRSSSERPRYIRTVALDVFNGEIWRTSEREVPEENRVVDGMPTPPGLQLEDVPVNEYVFSISDDYESSWLPLPYPAVQVDIDGDWRYDTATLDVVGKGVDTRGAEYTASSMVIEPTREALQAAGSPSTDLAALLELPDDLPGEVVEAAADITADATSTWERAVALQAYFRNTTGSNGFTYDTSVDYGSSSSNLVEFLTDKRGYCQHFAATMAVMARALDIPARVAVGFTAGDFLGDGTWSVRAHDSHAWPELYFEGVGWVPFEPTPAARTGLPPEHSVVPEEDDSPTTSPTNPSSSPSASPSVPGGPLEDVDDGTSSGGSNGTAAWLPVAAGGAGVAALLCLPSAAMRLRRNRRWNRAGDDSVARAEAAWSDLRESVADAGLSWNEAETPRMIGARVVAQAELTDRDEGLLNHLVDATERARYAPRAPQVPALRDHAAMLRRSLLRTRPFGRRLGVSLWPSSVRDFFATAGGRVVDGLDAVDAAVARLRASFLRAVRVGARR